MMQARAREKRETKFRCNYQASEGTGVTFDEKEGRTKQSMKDECDINLIMKKFEKTGILPDMIKENPQYGDFSEPIEYRESLEIVRHAKEQFENLSAKVRARFDNNPEAFLEFATNPENAKEMVDLGLATERVVKDEGTALNEASINKLATAIGEKVKPTPKKVKTDE